MDIVTQLTPILSIFSLGVVIICGGMYLVSRIRQNDMQILRDANDDLRSSKDDQDKKITSLQQAVHTLEGKVSVLENRNKTLEDLVIVALKQYFFENPGIGASISTTLSEVTK